MILRLTRFTMKDKRGELDTIPLIHTTLFCPIWVFFLRIYSSNHLDFRGNFASNSQPESIKLTNKQKISMSQRKTFISSQILSDLFVIISFICFFLSHFRCSRLKRTFSVHFHLFVGRSPNFRSKANILCLSSMFFDCVRFVAEC